MTLKRRRFLRRVASAGGGALIAPSLVGLAACNDLLGVDPQPEAPPRSLDYGRLRPSPDSPELEVPLGFRCVRIGWGGQESRVRTDLIVPNAFDGMAAFPLPNGNVRLIRNHEMVETADRGVAFGSPAYDPLGSGGTTSVDVRILGADGDIEIEVVDEFVSLAGTRVNCAGGRTPWGSWLSCEETTSGLAQGFHKPHGYVFEVPSLANAPVTPEPLRAMGRFVHEAVAVDAVTGFVYQTEDALYVLDDDAQPGAGFYRFIPKREGVLLEGGRLEMLALAGQPGFITVSGMEKGRAFPVEWAPIEDPDPNDAESDPHAVFHQGLAQGGTVFARLEGAFAGDGGIYFVSTDGGAARSGQVFFYQPSSANGGDLTLVFESPSPEVLDGPDNICLSPRGGLILCEDGVDDQFIRGLDRNGSILDLVRTPRAPGADQPGEFAGPCWSPDGRILFFNVQGSAQGDGTVSSGTYALSGPWANGPL